MPTRREEDYRLLHDQNEIGSKESLDDSHCSRSGHDPGLSLINRLRAPAKIGSTTLLLLILSGTVNVLLAALLMSYFFYPSFPAQKAIYTGQSNISPYGQILKHCR